MIRINRFSSFFSFLIFLLISLLPITFLNSCGGGGGGGTPGITYTGATSPAIIDEYNAYDIVAGSYEGGDTASSLNIFGAVQENSTELKDPFFLIIADYFTNVSYQFENSANQNAEFVGAVISDNDSIAGSCGGSASYSISGNDQTGTFNGSIQFNNLCDANYYAKGPASIAGDFNPDTGELNNIRISFTNMTMAHHGQSIGLNGSLSLNLVSSPMTITMSFVFKDNNLDKTYKFQNCVFEFFSGNGFVDVTITGRYYDYDYGFVYISTESPLRIYDLDYSPSSGIFLVTGTTGAVGGNTKARLNVIDSTSFYVEADTDGDGFFDDYNSGPISWNSI